MQVFLRSVLRLLVTAKVVPSSPILVILFLRKSVLTRATRHNIPEDGILPSHRRGNLISYMQVKLSTCMVLHSLFTYLFISIFYSFLCVEWRLLFWLSLFSSLPFLEPPQEGIAEQRMFPQKLNSCRVSRG
jgi:hypothetical protein